MHSASILLFLSIAFSASGSGQNKSNVLRSDDIWIGTNLHLGMSKELVTSRLAADYKLVKIQGGGDEWLVQSKTEPVVGFGHLGFHDGKLTYASKDWTQGDEDTVAFAQSLYGALEQFVKEDRRACNLDTGTQRSPTAEIRSAILFCGAKKLDIQTTQVFFGAGKGSYTQIQEILSSEQSR